MTAKTPTADDRVYFAHDPLHGMLKIGHSTNPEARLRTLATASHAVLTLLGTLPGGAAEEERLHRELAPHRHRNEWFAATPEVMAYVYGLFSRAGLPRTVEAELLRRNHCRNGLTGVRVAVAGQGAEIFTVVYTRWGPGTRLLLVVRSAHAGRDDLLRDVPAADACLMGDWPVTCRCWLETGNGDED